MKQSKLTLEVLNGILVMSFGNNHMAIPQEEALKLKEFITQLQMRGIFND